MADIFKETVRSRIMRQIRHKDTAPELEVRSFLHHRGYRYRLHARTLPGKPDIVLPRYRTVIFVNGCFWHPHKGCKYSHVPKSNISYWMPKLKKNVARAIRNRATLNKLGWNVIEIWQCELGKARLVSLVRELRGNLRTGSN